MKVNTFEFAGKIGIGTSQPKAMVEICRGRDSLKFYRDGRLELNGEVIAEGEEVDALGHRLYIALMSLNDK